MGADAVRVRTSIAIFVIALTSCTSTSSEKPRGATPPASATETTHLPPVQDLVPLGAQRINARPFPDWVLVAFGRAWVSGVKKGIAAYDAKTGDLERLVAVPQDECASLDAGFGAVWTATCGYGTRGVSRIDPRSGKVDGHVPVEVPIEGESSIGAGQGAVWAISNGPDCKGCVLVKIDPTSVRVAARYDIPEGGSAVRAGLGGVWITYQVRDQVVHIDPGTGDIVATVDVGARPVFLDIGVGGVWVMNQEDGSVSHVNPETDEAVATIAVDPNGIQGGDIAVGGGSVWLRGTEELVAQIDPVTDAVVARFGPAAGSGSADAGAGSLWISAHDATSIYRLPLH